MRVLIVDDHEVVRWGFRLLLGEQPWVERCLTAADQPEALSLTRHWTPHVALVDLFVGEASGADLCQAILRESPTTNVLLMSGAGWLSPPAARAAGARGFVPKDWLADDILMAVRVIGNGMTVFATQEDQSSLRLSSRERQIVDLMARGSTNGEIAETLHISPHTVKDHASSLYRRLGVRNRTEAVRRAERLGLTN